MVSLKREFQKKEQPSSGTGAGAVAGTGTNNSLLALLDAASKVELLPVEDTPDSRASKPHRSRLALPSVSMTVSSPTKGGANPSSMTTITTNSHHKTPSRALAFPVTLMKLLDDPSNSDILTFLPDGRSFVISDPKRFASDLMPHHFHVLRFPTFLKRLGRWGFTQIRRPGSPEHGAYRHPEFCRGDWKSCRKIRCHQQTAVKFAGEVRFTTTEQMNAMSMSMSSLDNDTCSANANDHQLLAQALQQQQQQQSHQQQTTETLQQHQQQESCRPLEREIKMQLEFAQRLRLQAALQKRAIASGRPSSTISQSAVDNATKAVVGAAIASIRRDKLFEQRKKLLKELEEQQRQALESRRMALADVALSTTSSSSSSPTPMPNAGPRTAANLDAMASRLLSGTKCFGTHENLAAMARVAKLKTQVTALRRERQLSGMGSSGCGRSSSGMQRAGPAA